MSLNNKYNILCVDDVQSNLYTYEAILSKIKNINIHLATSGKEAFDLLLKNKIDLILLDIQMPEMDGYEVAKLLKQNQETKSIPIVFITAVFKKEEFISKGFELGAVDYLTKPLDDNLLLNRIKLYLDVFRQKKLAEDNMERFYDIAQNVGDGLYVLDLNQNVSFINNAALKMLGYRRDELLNQSMHSIAHYKDLDGNFRPNDTCEVHKVLSNGRTISIDDDTFIKKDGSSIPVSLVATPILDNSIVSGVVVLFRDISKQKRLFELEVQKQTYEKEMIYAMVDMIDKRDTYTAGHSNRVAKYCKLIALEMGYNDEEIDLLVHAAHIHDIGKVTTPDTILLKPGKLQQHEYDIIKMHLTNGYELLSQVKAYKDISEIMYHHHERYDGNGYPQGLKANEIPPLARIMIVADAFDAMTTNRIYKHKVNVEKALKEIKSLSKKQFHPEVVDVALKALKKIDTSELIDQQPTSLIEEQRYAYYYKDRLTDLFTMEYLPVILKKYFYEEEISLYKIKLHNFSEYNKVFSWEDGDELLNEYAKFLKQKFQDSILFRVEGDDFLIVSKQELDMDEDDLSIGSFSKLDSIHLSVSSIKKSIKDTDENLIEEIRNL